MGAEIFRPVLVITVLAKARCCGREQNIVSWSREFAGSCHGGFHVGNLFEVNCWGIPRALEGFSKQPQQFLTARGEPEDMARL
jgi:hypothetical protein